MEGFGARNNGTGTHQCVIKMIRSSTYGLHYAWIVSGSGERTIRDVMIINKFLCTTLTRARSRALALARIS
jgi:hypothetical protein